MQLETLADAKHNVLNKQFALEDAVTRLLEVIRNHARTIRQPESFVHNHPNLWPDYIRREYEAKCQAQTALKEAEQIVEHWEAYSDPAPCTTSLNDVFNAARERLRSMGITSSTLEPTNEVR